MFAGIRGKYTKKIDASECKECSAGYYSDVVGPPETPYCKSCPRGKVGRLTGATTEASTCDNCVAGRFSDISGRAAMAFPANIETDCFECAFALEQERSDWLPRWILFPQQEDQLAV